MLCLKLQCGFGYSNKYSVLKYSMESGPETDTLGTLVLTYSMVSGTRISALS